MTPSMWRLLEYLAVTAGVVATAWVLHTITVRYLRRWATRSNTSLVGTMVRELERAIKPLAGLAIIEASLNFLPLPREFLHASNRFLSLALLVVALFYCSRILQLLLDTWLDRYEGRASLREPVRFTSHVVFAGLALMIVLDNLGISLTAVWTTLGVGSVAVALALQDTLTNFFAGVYVHLDNPVHVGDYIKLDSGQEGFVVQLGWRSARVRTLSNNTVVVPNSKLASAILTNFSLPDAAMSLTIEVNVSYDSDPEQVEQILIDEGRRALGHIPGLVTDSSPSVRFIPGFGDSSLGFSLDCRVASFVDQYFVQHELRKRIFARFRKEGICIPYPQRDIHVYSAGPAEQEMPASARLVARAS